MASRSLLPRLATLLRPPALAAARPLSSRPEAPLINDALAHLRTVRLISEAGEDCGLMPAAEALRRARQANRDIMQVSASENPNAPPPVVRLLDYAAYEEARRKKLYDKRKAAKESKRLQRKEGALKQVRLSPSTDKHDMDVKMRHAKDFLLAGYRVKVYMQFRRGQGRLQESAKAALVAAARQLSHFGAVQGVPPDANFEDLFSEDPPEEEGEGPAQKKRPLQVTIFPFARKVREQIANQAADNDPLSARPAYH